MILNRNNAIIGGLLIVVAAGFALSWGFAANSGSAGRANLGNVPSATLLVGIFGVMFTLSQAYTLFSIRQLSNRMSQMDTRLTNQIGDLDKRMHDRFLIIETRFTQLENRIDHRIDGLEKRIDGLENRIDSRFAQVEERFTQVDIRLDNIQQNYVDEMKYRLREE